MLRSRIVVPRRFANGNVDVRHRPHREIRMTEHRISARIRRPVGGGGRSQQRDLYVARKKASDEVVHVALEPAEAMQRIDRSRKDRDTQRLSFTRSHERFRPVSGHEVLVKCFHSLDDDGDVEVQGGPPGGGFAEALAKRAIGREACDIVRKAVHRVRQKPGFFIDDDVSGSACVHRGNRNRQCARFDQHAAQRLRPYRRKHQQLGVAQPSEYVVAISPTDQPHIAAGGSGRAFDRLAFRAVADHDERHRETRTRGHVDEHARAFVVRQLSRRIQRMARVTAGSWHPHPPARPVASTPFGITSIRARSSVGRALAERRSYVTADSHDGISVGESGLFAAEIRPHIGNRRQRRRPCRAGARTQTPRHR